MRLISCGQQFLVVEMARFPTWQQLQHIHDMQMIPRNNYVTSAYCLLKKSIVTLDRLLSASTIYADNLDGG